jgi:para-aminobenzoate synthetase / 4-amino-4-deoxychorismate lyase
VTGAVVLSGDRWRIGPSRFANPSREIQAEGPAEVLPALRAAEAAAEAGSWVAGFVSYQAAPGLDQRLKVPGAGRERLPLIWFGVFDQPAPAALATHGHFSLGRWRAAMSREDHAAKVGIIRDEISAGQTYQVNLTFPMVGDFEGEPESLLGALTRTQPDSHAALIDLGSSQILSVSPELFLKRAGTTLTTKPMKGTARRGRWPSEDQLIRDRLIASEKERAGNVMIVDMLRNDMGKVAMTGSVEVSELFGAERHPTVWQLTSTVESEIEDGVELADLFRAVFPSGSVTGAPKESTMEIIARLEGVPREAYCGAIGYIEPGGRRFEFSVAIRTGILSGSRFTYHVGGGITYDSVAEAEYEECLWKALVVTQHLPVPSLIETMRYDPDAGIPLLPRHVRRLAASASYWGIDLDLVALGEALSGIEGPNGAKIRVLLGPDGRIEVSSEPLPTWDEPVSILVSDVRVDAADPYWYHKVADRSRYPVSDDQTEMLMTNLDGEVTETNRSNLLAHVGGRWMTPPLGSGCLPGVARSEAMESMDIVERPMTIHDLMSADELAVTNAVRGWRKAVLIR